MKAFLSMLCMVPVLWLQAQIQIDIVEEEVVEEVPDEMAAPEGGDHSTSKVSGPETDLLHFLNGDRLSGELQRIDADEGAVWKHPDAKSDTVFALENLKQIEFKAGAAEQEDLMLLPRIELTNGDRYRGRIVRMDSEFLEIDSPIGGRFQFRSDMVHSIRPVAGNNAIYSGPASQEEWTQNNNNEDKRWTYKNGAIYSSSHNQIAGMKIEKLPSQVSFSFSAEWKGSINLQVALWGKDPKNVNQNCYTLNMQNTYLRCYRNLNNVGRKDLGNAQIREVMQDGQVDVRLLMNREKKEVIAFFDGNMVARWSDAFDGEIKGNAIAFGSMGNTPVKISAVTIREWDGEFDMDSGEKPQEMDQLVTLNGDIFAGQLEKIEEELLHFKNDFAVFQVPVDRVSEISFSKTTRSEPRLQAGDVVISFPGRERVTLQLTSLDDKELVGVSEATGEVRLLKKFFMEMQLNPYDDRHLVEEDLW